MKARTLNEQIQNDVRGVMDPVHGVAEEMGLYMGERPPIPVWAIMDRPLEQFDPDNGEISVTSRETKVWLNAEDFPGEHLVEGDIAILHNIAYRVFKIGPVNRGAWWLLLRKAPDIELEDYQFGTYSTDYP
jgi:hypothetical protein